VKAFEARGAYGMLDEAIRESLQTFIDNDAIARGMMRYMCEMLKIVLWTSRQRERDAESKSVKMELVA
jgi:hypothetical protein